MLLILYLKLERTVSKIQFLVLRLHGIPFLGRKQKEYFAFIDHYYDSRNDEVHQDTYRQVGARLLSSRYSEFFHLGTSLLVVEVLYLEGP